MWCVERALCVLLANACSPSPRDDDKLVLPPLLLTHTATSRLPGLTLPLSPPPFQSNFPFAWPHSSSSLPLPPSERLPVCLASLLQPGGRRHQDSAHAAGGEVCFRGGGGGVHLGRTRLAPNLQLFSPLPPPGSDTQPSPLRLSAPPPLLPGHVHASSWSPDDGPCGRGQRGGAGFGARPAAGHTLVAFAARTGAWVASGGGEVVRVGGPMRQGCRVHGPG